QTQLDLQRAEDIEFLYIPARQEENVFITAGQREGFLAVDPSLLSIETACDFPIYVYVSTASRFVLLKAENLPITRKQLQQVQSGGRRPFFVPRNFAGSLKLFAAQNLRALAGNTDMDPATRSRQTYAISKTLLAGVFSPDADPGQMEEASRCVGDALVDLIGTGREALRHLILAESHDPGIYTHSLNICVLGTALTHYLHTDWPREHLQDLAQGFLLHDVGKIDIPSEIWTKPDKLTAPELELVRKHPLYGFERIGKFEKMSEEARRVVLHHHERCDGSGYPFGLSIREISEGARICAILEPFDDLTSDRPYHKRVTVFQALQMMKEEGMQRYDFDLYKAFLSFFRDVSNPGY
ncbi:MAG TPA: HD domain-containing phosphohydrolase, partial [bacterium]|nr:HD domain-containing phosphohydrolase [bacterium]